MFKPPKNTPLVIFRLTLTAIIIYTLAKHMILNSRAIIWQDEALMFYMANHTPFTGYFMVAMKGMVSGMPWPFIEYWLYYHLLDHFVPFGLLMEHVEFFLRLPLTFYSAVAMASVYGMTRRLSNSYIFAGLCTILLFTANSMASHLGSEVRQHTSGYAHTALSWFLLTMVLTAPPEEKIRKYIWLSLWSLSAIITGGTHIFATYSVFLQIMIFVAAGHRLLPSRFDLSHYSSLAKTASLLAVYGMAVVEALYFRFLSTKPDPRPAQLADNTEIFFHSVSELGRQMFIPNFWPWVTFFLLATGLAIWREKQVKARLKLGFLGLLGAAQIAATLFICFKYFKMGWGPDYWMGRYTWIGLTPFVFCLSTLAGNLWEKPDEQKFLLPVSIIGIILFCASPGFTRTYWGGLSMDFSRESNPYVLIKNEIARFDAFDKTMFVLGLKPTQDPSSQEDIHGRLVDQSWQIYTGGPFNMARIWQHPTMYANRINIPCEHRDKLPFAGFKASLYAVDFCEKDKIYLRVVKP